METEDLTGPVTVQSDLIMLNRNDDQEPRSSLSADDVDQIGTSAFKLTQGMSEKVCRDHIPNFSSSPSVSLSLSIYIYIYSLC